MFLKLPLNQKNPEVRDLTVDFLMKLDISKPYDLAPAETAKDLAPDFGSKDNRIYQI